MIRQALCYTLVVSYTLMLSCNKPTTPSDNKNNTTSSLSTPGTAATVEAENRFHKGIGAPIAREKAEQWKQKYRTLRGTTQIQYSFKADVLKALLTQDTSVVCIAFYLVNTQQGLDILPIGVSHTNGLVKKETLISARGQLFSWTKAQQLRDSYSGTTKALIFGANTFTRLIENQEAQTILIEPGINDSNEETLLLSDANDNDSPVEDNASRCPTACP